MKINMRKLSQEIKNKNTIIVKPNSSEAGMAYFMDIVINHSATESINFNSFTYDEAILAFNEFYYLPSDEYTDDFSEEDYDNIKNNMWSSYMQTQEFFVRWSQETKKYIVMRMILFRRGEENDINFDGCRV